MEKPEPHKEHDWLKRLAGEWTFEHDSPTAPDQPPTKFSGRERVRLVGDVWAICEGEVAMPDGTLGRNIMTLGYDPAKQTFLGTFVSSMMTHLWIYESGTLDESGSSLTLNTTGPSFTEGGGTAKYRDTIEWVNDTERILSSAVEQSDGTWQPFMRATYRRV